MWRDKQDKALLALDRERQELWKAERTQAPIKLDKPIRRGWKKYYVLRADIARRDDAVTFHRILEKVNTTIYCRARDFKEKKNKVRVDMPHELGFIETKKWDLPPAYKKFFVYKEKLKHGKYGKTWQKGWFFLYPYMFVTKVKPHYLTHYRPVDGEIETRLAEIGGYLYRDGNDTRLNHLLGYSYHDDWDCKSHEKWDEVLEEQEEK
jgi:hypothetical protein